ncbi:hypothetical protein GJ496_007279 [Pomphorhynchus laevis]|nr:hypothetical protein GJ496_007279 [Pomphorhynchus laevis]
MVHHINIPHQSLAVSELFTICMHVRLSIRVSEPYVTVMRALVHVLYTMKTIASSVAWKSQITYPDTLVRLKHRIDFAIARSSFTCLRALRSKRNFPVTCHTWNDSSGKSCATQLLRFDFLVERAI